MPTRVRLCACLARHPSPNPRCGGVGGANSGTSAVAGGCFVARVDEESMSDVGNAMLFCLTPGTSGSATPQGPRRTCVPHGRAAHEPAAKTACASHANTRRAHHSYQVGRVARVMVRRAFDVPSDGGVECSRRSSVDLSSRITPSGIELCDGQMSIDCPRSLPRFASDASRVLTCSTDSTARVSRVPFAKHKGEGTQLVGM
jgi:hypothetical protein